MLLGSYIFKCFGMFYILYVDIYTVNAWTLAGVRRDYYYTIIIKYILELKLIEVHCGCVKQHRLTSKLCRVS